jgi:hypothetical protein
MINIAVSRYLKIKIIMYYFNTAMSNLWLNFLKIISMKYNKNEILHCKMLNVYT